MNAPAPRLLYHYTTQTGFIGIVCSREIWASKIHYLNDSQEFAVGLDIARRILSRRRSIESDSTQLTKIACLEGNLDTIEKINICVCSFSSEPDLLSQWRAYGGGTGGYAIGFRHDTLAKLCVGRKFQLVRCVYERSEQEQMLEQLIESSLAQDFNTNPGTSEVKDGVVTMRRFRTGGDFREKFCELAPLLKHSSFREEAEWRLVSTQGLSVMDLQFRAGKSAIIPYSAFPLGDNLHDAVDSVTIGPTATPDLAHSSAQMLLTKQRGGAAGQLIQVTSSKIPYRNW